MSSVAKSEPQVTIGVFCFIFNPNFLLLFFSLLVIHCFLDLLGLSLLKIGVRLSL